MKPLNVLYDRLDFKSGGLFTATGDPSACRKRSDWVEKGEWLVTAKQAGAEKIFFIENNPVAVFSECGAAIEEKVKAFNQARDAPMLLLATHLGAHPEKKPMKAQKHSKKFYLIGVTPITNRLEITNLRRRFSGVRSIFKKTAARQGCWSPPVCCLSIAVQPGHSGNSGSTV